MHLAHAVLGLVDRRAELPGDRVEIVDVHRQARFHRQNLVRTGLSPNVDLYLFVVALEKTNKPSRPGKAFKINLQDMFPMK